MFRVIETIQWFVAPVVMISANGLLCLAFYNRLSSIVNRSRTINKERFELAVRHSALAATPGCPEALHIVRRIQVLDELGHQLYDRARLMRATLIALLVSVVFMLACSLALGLSPLGASLGWAALGLFVAGSLAMMYGVLLAAQELRISLDPLLFEHEGMEK
jgi:hypothetical protein